MYLLQSARGSGTWGRWGRVHRGVGSRAGLARAADVRSRGGPTILRDEADSYRKLLDEAPTGILVHRDGTIRYANRMTADLLGVGAPDSLRGSSLLEFVPEEDHEAASARIRRIQEERVATSRREYRVLRPDGEERFVEARGLPVRWDGESCAMAAIRDITERKRAEEALRQSERRFRQLFQRVQDPIYITDEDGRIVEANPAFADLFGCSEEELDRVNARDLYATPGDRDRFRREIEETGSVEDFEVRLKRADGREMICELTSVMVRDDGEVRYQGVIRDVTEERQAREEWQHRALHDDLTGLPNRSLLWDRLQHAIERADRRDGLLAVLFVDIDDFKAINDRRGHSFGDRILRETSRAMQQALREEDTVARYGGDEFSVVLENVEAPGDVRAAVDRLRRAVEGVKRTPDTEQPLSVSVGMALYDPADADRDRSKEDRARLLLDEADRVMLDRKRQEAGKAAR